MKNRKAYEGWSNDRMDDLIADRTYTRISDVDRWNDKVKFRCNICGHEFEATPNNISQGSGCPVCRRNNQVGKRRKAKFTQEEVAKICLDLGWELQDTYVNSNTHITLKCIHCGHVVKKQLRVLRNGYSRCPSCGE